MKRDALPTLSCTQLVAPVVAEQAATDSATPPDRRFGMAPLLRGTGEDYDGLFIWATVHPITGTGEPLGLRASFTLRVPAPAAEFPPAANWAGYSSRAQIDFVPAFEPSGRVQTASISLRALFHAARMAGVDLPSFEAKQTDYLAALPVLGERAGEAEGLLLNEQLPLWVHGAGTSRGVGRTHRGRRSPAGSAPCKVVRTSWPCSAVIPMGHSRYSSFLLAGRGVCFECPARAREFSRAILMRSRLAHEVRWPSGAPPRAASLRRARIPRCSFTTTAVSPRSRLGRGCFWRMRPNANRQRVTIAQ